MLYSTVQYKRHCTEVGCTALYRTLQTMLTVLYCTHGTVLCQVWDRRALGVQRHPVGYMVGHCEGITHICSKGDGHHFISNGKDQTIKLWDIRNMHTSKSIKA